MGFNAPHLDPATVNSVGRAFFLYAFLISAWAITQTYQQLPISVSTHREFGMSDQIIRQERLKLFANVLNIAAAGSFLAATVTQPFYWLSATSTDRMTEVSFGLISFAFAVALHLAAQATLGRL